MADVAYESVLCVKNEVFVYRIPPRPSNRGYRAAEWKLDVPDWTGRLRVVAINKDLIIKLENKEGELFAQCPVESYPSMALEPVMDSSRYFVIRIKDDSGRSAFIGIGFADRSDSFDLNVTIQDHFKWLKQEQEAEKASKELKQGPSLDLGFKAGQTITLNIGTKKGDSTAKPRPKPHTTGGGLGPLLPPPPGGSSSNSGAVRILPSGVVQPPSEPSAPFCIDNTTAFSYMPGPARNSGSSGGGGGSSNVDLLLGLDSNNWSSPASSALPLAPTPLLSQDSNSGADLWGDFTSAPVSSSTQAASFCSSSGGDWVQF